MRFASLGPSATICRQRLRCCARKSPICRWNSFFSVSVPCSLVCFVLISACFGLLCCAAQASDIGVVGLFPGKAVLVVDGAAPKTYSAGSTVADGVKLIAVGTSSATIEIGGKRQNFPIGEHFSRSASIGPAATSLRADGQGHFVTQGQINGGTVTMLVDTGASQKAQTTTEAKQHRNENQKGKRGYSQTANGVVAVYRVNLDSVKVGDITLNQVEARVHENRL